MVTVEDVCEEAVRFISEPCELLSETTALRLVVGTVSESDIDAPISAVDAKSDIRLSEGDGTVVAVDTETDTSISSVDANVTARLSEVDKMVTVVDTDSKAPISVADVTSALGFSRRDTTLLVVGKTDNT